MLYREVVVMAGKMGEIELVACYCRDCKGCFYTTTDEIKCCPYCGSRRVSVEYDIEVRAEEKERERGTWW